MIGRLVGSIVEKMPPELVIDVQGVGYECQAPMSTFYAISDTSQVTLYTHLSIREDAHQLYAFSSKRERQLFRTLIKVNGVGPKLALAILSNMTADEFVQLIHQGNSNALVKLPGVGKKTAERLVIEMADRLKDWHYAAATATQASTQQTVPLSGLEATTAQSHSLQQQTQDAESALIALGYKAAEASRMVQAIVKKIDTGSVKTEDIIRLALKGLA